MNPEQNHQKLETIFRLIHSTITKGSMSPISAIDIIATYNLCVQLTNTYDESHNVAHHIAVLRNAIAIFLNLSPPENKGEDHDGLLKLVFYVCLLHDTLDKKYTKKLEPDELAKKILTVDSFMKDKLGDMSFDAQWIIDNISFSTQKKQKEKLIPLIQSDSTVLVALEICSDADKLEAIGKIGLDRCRTYTKENNPDATEEQINAHMIQHCKEKLLLLKDSYILTPIGKQLAEPLHQIIVDFIEHNS